MSATATKAKRKAPPTHPEIKPPGTVSSARPVHGPSEVRRSLTPFDMLCGTLQLSNGVSLDELLRSAVAEIERLREGSTEPVPWVDEPDDAPIGRGSLAAL